MPACKLHCAYIPMITVSSTMMTAAMMSLSFMSSRGFEFEQEEVVDLMSLKSGLANTVLMSETSVYHRGPTH